MKSSLWSVVPTALTGPAIIVPQGRGSEPSFRWAQQPRTLCRPRRPHGAWISGRRRRLHTEDPGARSPEQSARNALGTATKVFPTSHAGVSSGEGRARRAPTRRDWRDVAGARQGGVPSNIADEDRRPDSRFRARVALFTCSISPGGGNICGLRRVPRPRIYLDTFVPGRKCLSLTILPPPPPANPVPPPMTATEQISLSIDSMHPVNLRQATMDVAHRLSSLKSFVPAAHELLTCEHLPLTDIQRHRRKVCRMRCPCVRCVVSKCPIVLDRNSYRGKFASQQK